MTGTLFVVNTLSDEQIALIKQNLEKTAGSNIEFELKTDDTLIGGFYAIVNGKVYDGSVRGRLKEFHKYLRVNDHE